ncbi:hypothetical protein CHS0354_011481 [Potamilus streckersoni]|uniref:Transmembrane protein 161B n=1 Tax=Potamilus streckersoni TaxID=2493646 RepID=A0AAE0SLE0_9BIVA|nr:hypothetical protein CHS0354_011481 [Potamilus streckersoni]
MAVFGAQLVFNLIIFSFLQKLSPIYSFGRWLLCGRLFRYLHPTDEQIKSAAGMSSGKVKNRREEKRRHANAKLDTTFNVPRSTHIHLDTAPVEAIDLVSLHYYPEYQWLMDFWFAAVVVYILTEVYYGLLPRNEMNISVMWCLLAIGFCLRLLFMQTSIYFTLEEGGERILVVTFGFFYLVAAMGVLVVDEKILEFGLEEAYTNFSLSATKFLNTHGIDSQGPVSYLTFKIILAFVCSIIGALLIFPGFRMAKLHLDSLKYSRENRLKQIILHLNFIFPLILVLFWVRPISREILCGLSWEVTTRLLSESVFEVLRIFLFVIFCITRLVLMATHVQSHLNSAYERIENLRKESGKISNVEIQKIVARIFFYSCMITLQYITPVLLLTLLMMLYKTLGDFSWVALFGEPAEKFVESLLGPQADVAATVTEPAIANSTTDSIVAKATEFSLAFMNLRQVFTPLWYRGLLSFLLWWTSASWFTSMAFGVYYYSRMT